MLAHVCNTGPALSDAVAICSKAVVKRLAMDTVHETSSPSIWTCDCHDISLELTICMRGRARSACTYSKTFWMSRPIWIALAAAPPCLTPSSAWRISLCNNLITLSSNASVHPSRNAPCHSEQIFISAMKVSSLSRCSSVLILSRANNSNTNVKYGSLRIRALSSRPYLGKSVTACGVPPSGWPTR